MNLLHTEEDFDLEEFCDFLYEEYEDQDQLVRRHQLDETTAIFMHISFRNSRHLKHAIFLEPRLGVTVVKKMRDLIAFYDSLGYVPQNEERGRVGKALSAGALKRLFPDQASTQLTSVSLRNTDLGITTTRSRSFVAPNVEETVSALDDGAQVCTRAVGYSAQNFDNDDGPVRRYVGFANARITEDSSRWLPLDEYLEWLNTIVRQVEGAHMPLSTFRRYAPEHLDIDDPEPVHILLDLLDVQRAYETSGALTAEGDPMIIEDCACEVQDGIFNLLILT